MSDSTPILTSLEDDTNFSSPVGPDHSTLVSFGYFSAILLISPGSLTTIAEMTKCRRVLSFPRSPDSSTSAILSRLMKRP